MYNIFGSTLWLLSIVSARVKPKEGQSIHNMLLLPIAGYMRELLYFGNSLANMDSDRAAFWFPKNRAEMEEILNKSRREPI